jgi:hypothetical protein
VFFDVYVLELLRFESIKFSHATLSDINVVLCYATFSRSTPCGVYVGTVKMDLFIWRQLLEHRTATGRLIPSYKEDLTR